MVYPIACLFAMHRWIYYLLYYGFGLWFWILNTFILESIAQEVHQNITHPKKTLWQQALIHTQEAKRHSRAAAEYHFILAQAYSSEGDLDRAIEEYTLTLVFDQKSPLVYTRLATEYLKKGMISSAMDACQQALRLDSQYVDARFILAGIYAVLPESDQAIKEYNTILKANPSHEQSAIFKAQILLETGQINLAIQGLNHFLKHKKDSAQAYYYLGRSYQEIKNEAKAIKSYQHALSISPGLSEAAFSLARLYENNGKVDQAILVYQLLFNENQDIAAASRLVSIFLKRSQYQQAIPFLEYLELSDPEDLNVQFKLGLIYIEIKEYTLAIRIFESILKKKSDADKVRYYLGLLYSENHQIDLAIKELKKIKINSEFYSPSVLQLILILRQSNRLLEAQSEMQKALLQAPKNLDFYLFQASLEEESNQFQGALKTLQNALEHFPNNEQIHYYLGSLYDRRGQLEKSLEHMETVLKLNPDHAEALNYIGYTWTQQKIRLPDAEKLLKKALILRPDNGYIQDSWGWYLFTVGKLKESIIALEKASQLEPLESTIFEHLGDAYLRSNLRDKAFRCYQKAFELTKDLNIKEKIQIKVEHLKKEWIQGSNMHIK